jgi:DnaJ-class molecular chaperone
MNYYKILEIEQGADLSTIKKAYKKKAFKVHPDRNPDPAVRQEYTLIQEAYDVLSDPAKRKEHDLMLNPRRNIFEEDQYTVNVNDLFRAKEYARSANNNILSAKITLEEAFNGCRRFIYDEDKYVNIPAGSVNGSRWKSGNKTIVVSIQPHPVYRVDKLDLYTTLYIDAIQAMVGIDLIINHPNGKTLKTKLLPGTQEGQKIKLSGQGLGRDNDKKGDLYIFCHIVIPQLTDAERDSIMYLLNNSSAEI